MIRAFVRAPSGVLSLAAILALVALSVVAPALWGEGATALHVIDANRGPSAAHLFGTDQLGRDILLRVLVASRLSLILALAAATIGAAIGIPLGVGATVLPPRIRTVVLRTIDALLAFPGLLVAIFVGAIVGIGPLGAATGVGLAISFSYARIASSLSLAVAGREYVSAARVLGIKLPRLMLRYILPNVAETLAITTTVSVTNSIVSVSSLSFLGLGVQPPDFDWGRMLTEGVNSLYVAPAAAVIPALAIAASSLAFGFFGEALARAMNPLLWTGGTMQPSPSPAIMPIPIAVRTTRPELPPFGIARTGSRAADGNVLEVQDLVVSFPIGGRDVRILHGVSFSLRHGERLGIVGESGSGKTMTAMAIAQLLPSEATVSGTISFEGRDLGALSRRETERLLGTKLAIVYQDPLSSLNPALRIGTQLTEGAVFHRGLSQTSAQALAVEHLTEVNIPAAGVLLERHPHELSGGMRQRSVIAMGLMTEPSLLLADEPTTALDVTVQAQVMDVLQRINRDHGTAVILISHNLGLVSQNCDRIIVMYAGRIVEDIAVEDLASTARHPYTRALLKAVPTMSRPRGERLEYIRGQAPDPAAVPTGCPYHPRCPIAIDRCRSDGPPLVEMPADAQVACWLATEAPP